MITETSCCQLHLYKGDRESMVSCEGCESSTWNERSEIQYKVGMGDAEY